MSDFGVAQNLDFVVALVIAAPTFSLIFSEGGEIKLTSTVISTNKPNWLLAVIFKRSTVGRENLLSNPYFKAKPKLCVFVNGQFSGHFFGKFFLILKKFSPLKHFPNFVFFQKRVLKKTFFFECQKHFQNFFFITFYNVLSVRSVIWLVGPHLSNWSRAFLLKHTKFTNHVNLVCFKRNERDQLERLARLQTLYCFESFLSKKKCQLNCSLSKTNSFSFALK